MDRIADAVRRALGEPSAALAFDSMESKPHVADQVPPAAARIATARTAWAIRKVASLWLL